MTLSDKAREYAERSEKGEYINFLKTCELLRELADENDRLRTELHDHAKFGRDVTFRATLKAARNEGTDQ